MLVDYSIWGLIIGSGAFIVGALVGWYARGGE
jgi:hypothetical protein